MVAGRARRVEPRRFEHAPDRPGGVGEVVVTATVHERAARGRSHEAEQHAQGRRLPRAVGAEEPGDRAGLDDEAQVVDGEDVAEALGEPPGDDLGLDARPSLDRCRDDALRR
jgi:hypothetical protein